MKDEELAVVEEAKTWVKCIISLRDVHSKIEFEN